jgi:hypothetical protein
MPSASPRWTYEISGLTGLAGPVTSSNVHVGLAGEGNFDEPASLALLGIGTTGFLAFRRFFKKTSAA